MLPHLSRVKSMLAQKDVTEMETEPAATYNKTYFISGDGAVELRNHVFMR